MDNQSEPNKTDFSDLFGDYKQDFFEFLENNKALDIFKANCNAPGLINDFQGISFISSEKPLVFILRSFCWSRTYQGGLYWAELSKKWMQYLKNKEKQK
jgi:hypothetical protein